MAAIHEHAYINARNRLRDEDESAIEKHAAAEAQINLDATAAVTKSGEMKAVEASLADKLLAKLETKDCNKSALSGEVSTLRALHDKILRFEVDNAITSLVRPSVDAVGRVLEVIGTPGAVVYPSASGSNNGNVVINNNVGGGKATANSKSTAPKAPPAPVAAPMDSTTKEEVKEAIKEEVVEAKVEAKEEAK